LPICRSTGAGCGRGCGRGSPSAVLRKSVRPVLRELLEDLRPEYDLAAVGLELLDVELGIALVRDRDVRLVVRPVPRRASALDLLVTPAELGACEHQDDRFLLRAEPIDNAGAAGPDDHPAVVAVSPGLADLHPVDRRARERDGDVHFLG